MKKILFVCSDGTHASAMAASIGRKLWGAAFDYLAASVQVKEAHPLGSAVLKKHQVVPFEKTPVLLSTVNVEDFYAIVTLSGLAEEETPTPSGKVQKYYWALPNASQVQGEPALIEEMFERVYFEIEGNLREISKYLLPH